MRLLLDTHVLLWWLADDRKLSKDARAMIADPEHQVLVSAASAWEVAIKAALKRIEIELDDLEDAIRKSGFEPLPIAVQ
ncbi:MAG: type II toxin-antitoxin system VapC family toxin, partial [Candidatus Binatia bacterium]